MFKYFVHVLALMMTNSVNAQTNIHDLQGAWLGEMQIPDGPKLKIGVEILKKKWPMGRQYCQPRSKPTLYPCI
jgi:hypothetical protein